MFSWTKQEATTTDVNDLQDYHSIMMRTDTDESIKVGDYVRLKYRKFLPDRHADLFANPDHQEGENYYGYVMSFKIPVNPNECLDLGRLGDVRIAVVTHNQVKINLADSRLLYTVADTHVCPMLKEFVRDSCITEVSLGMLVRPRTHTQITNSECYLSTSYAKEFKTPLMVVRINESTVTLAGTVGRSIIIETATINRDLLCAV